MNSLFHSRRASLLAGLALAFLLGAPLTVSAQKSERTRVVNSILGIGIGIKLDIVRAKLDRLSTRKGRESLEGQEKQQEEAEEREGGRKEAWTLTSTNYATLAVKTDDKGRVVWVTGFVRPGQEIPFAKLGDLSSATTSNDARAIWNVATPRGGYRLVAKGQDGKARVVSLLFLALQAAR